ncbi:glycoside hydrolase family 43 protein [Chitinophaga sancti]|uniref:glycoside hydrolase family 43 protein n=1 Tax=Chitinophaga sancti TaxID=1004 RepID=UPI003F7B14A7
MVTQKLFFCIALFATFISTKCLAQQPSIFLADPTIFKDKGKYYLYGTGSPNGFPVYESADLKTWKPARGHADSLALTRGNAYGTEGFWAPQVFQHKGVYYMAYTANEQIAIATAKHPAGPFKQDSIHALRSRGKQIDPFIFFDDNGKVYLYHVKLEHGNRIFVVEMKPDLSDIIPGTEKELIAGTEPWENTAKTDWPVTEGPTVIKIKKTYYLVYSANDFRNKDYAVGYATATSPLGPWVKAKNSPFISRHNMGENGTGHGDIFFDQQHNMYYVLHTHRSADKVSPRATGMVKLKLVNPTTLVADSTSFQWLKAG